ncbi:MAG: hypothetical protein ACO1NO_13005 [Burkholderiaceae bacterium]
MAAVVYMKENWRAEVDIQRLPGGQFQGVVLLVDAGSDKHDPAPHAVNSTCDTAAEALEEAKALAHRLLADI